MSHEYVYKISSRYLQKWLRYSIKHVKNRHFSRHFGTSSWFSEFCFLTDFDASKSVLGSFFAFFAKIWPKNMYHSSKSRFLFYLFHLVTWDDLDLYYDHKAHEMILTDVSDTIHADSLALFALSIEILLANVTKPEKSKILTFTWPVTSSVISRSNFWPCTGSSRTGLSNGVWNLEIGPVVPTVSDIFPILAFDRLSLEVFTGQIFCPNSSPPHEAGSKSIPPQFQNLMGQPPQSISK